jgi:hypothetical protein
LQPSTGTKFNNNAMTIYTRLGRLCKVLNTGYKKSVNKEPFYLGVIVKYIVDNKVKKRTLLFTEAELELASARAKRLPFDIEQSVISKIID